MVEINAPVPTAPDCAYACRTMPRFTDEAVCIRHWDFSETSQTVSLFTRSRGVLRGLAKGSRRPKARFSGGIELLTRGRITALLKPSAELATFTEWDLEEIFPALARRLPAYYAGMYFVDLIQHLVGANDPHPRLFDLLIHSLRALGQSPHLTNTTPAQLLQFQWALLCETGYQPILDRDAETNLPFVDDSGILQVSTLAFSRTAGGTVADTGSGDRWRVRAETINLLRQLESAWASTTPHPSADPSTELSADSTATLPDALVPLPPLDDTTDLATIQRANRLLAAYLRTILDRELTTLQPALGPIPI